MQKNDTLEFLRLVLPTKGYYCAVVFSTAHPRPGIDFPRQSFFATVEELSEFLLANDAVGRTVYHACASFKEPTNRKHANVLAVKSFWLDVDAGEGKPYATAADAAGSVVEFCRDSGLDLPLFVGSGNGLHCYWPLAEDTDPQTWARHALGLKQLCAAQGLIADPSRTADLSSILRPVGSHHRKNGDRRVECGPFPKAVRASHFGRFCNAQPVLQNIRDKRSDTVISRIFASSSFSAVYANDVADRCAQVDALRRTGNIPEPHWYSVLGVLARCEDGDATAHEWSARDYPGYSASATDHKLSRARELTGATTCAKLDSVNPGVCASCPLWGTITSPVSATRDVEAADPEKPSIPGLPELPDTFQWSKTGQLCHTTETNDGEKYLTVVTENPIYLDSVQTGEVDRGSYSYKFKKLLPKDGWCDIVVDASVLHGASGIATMFGKGVVVHDSKMFLTYVRHAVDQFHHEEETMTRYDQFGWKHDDTAFLYGSMLYTAAGPVEAIGAKEVAMRSQWLGPRRAGSLHAWTEAADSLFASEMEAMSAVVLASFAAPLMRFQSAEEGGAVIHLFTPGSGMGKTTALMGAWTVWGVKEGLNLTNEDTKVSKPIALGTLGNLPVVYDELRNKDPEVIKSMVVMFTEGRDRMRGTVDGTIRHTKSRWQTIMLSAANSSLLDQLQGDGTDAPAYRVLELSTTLSKDIDKSKGDKLKRVLSENAGHAGDAYLRYLLQPEVLAWTKQALEQWTQEIWAQSNVDNAFRFRVRLIGAIAVAAALVNKLDILHFQTDRVVQWLIKQLGEGRHLGQISQTPSPDRAINALGDFINEHYGETVVVPDRFKARQSRMVPLLKPHNRLSIRYELAPQRVFIAETVFRDWAIKRQMSPRSILDQLKESGVVVDYRRNVTLSAGTDIPGAQTMCIEVNASHPAMSGLVAAVDELKKQA